MLADSERDEMSSNCHTAILFMTDGDMTTSLGCNGQSDCQPQDV